MNKPFDLNKSKQNRDQLRQKVLGFGKTSHQKSYYPLLSQRLQELERLRLLLDHSADAMFWAELPSGCLMDLNASAKKFLELSELEISNIYLTDIFSSSACKAINDLFINNHLDNNRVDNNRADNTRADLMPGIIIKSEMISKKNRCTPVEMTVGIRQIGEKKFAMVVARDITERLNAVAEQNKLEAQLRQSQKMEAVGQLAGGIAHDFNNLLQVIQGFGEIALMKLSPDDPISNDLNKIMKAVTRAVSLVRQLLIFSRKETIKKEYLDLNIIISNLTKMLKRIIGEHIDLVLNLKPDIPKIHADPGQIEQILMNLCLNSRDAMQDGGNITIETDQVFFTKQDCNHYLWALEGNYIILSVSDTGIGIEHDIQEHIFEPFFTTKETGKGTGLGLATVYAITNKHKGLINLYSEPGLGTTFRIYLPASYSEKQSVSVSKKQINTVGGNETILLAEDDEQVRELAESVLKNAGYNVLITSDGQEAVKIFNLHKDKIDLALIDVVMPKKGGIAVYNTITAKKPDIPILFCSGYSSNVLQSKNLLKKHVQLLTKPYDQKTLLIKIRELLNLKNNKIKKQ